MLTTDTHLTKYKPKAPHFTYNSHLANGLNSFYYCFDKRWNRAVIPTPPHTSLHTWDRDKPCQSTWTRFGVSIHLEATVLSPQFTDICNTSLETCHLTACFKASNNIPVSTKTRLTSLNGYRRISLTSVVMEITESLKALCCPISNQPQLGADCEQDIQNLTGPRLPA